jgi:uncharacterized protein YifE (UPF0438 family)
MTFTKEQHREYAARRTPQGSGDDGRYTLEDHERYRAEVDAREKEERERQTATAEKAAAKRSWLVSGGSESDFERQWDDLKDEARRQKVIHANTEARDAMRASRVSSI